MGENGVGDIAIPGWVRAPRQNTPDTRGTTKGLLTLQKTFLEQFGKSEESAIFYVVHYVVDELIGKGAPAQMKDELAQYARSDSYYRCVLAWKASGTFDEALYHEAVEAQLAVVQLRNTQQEPEGGVAAAPPAFDEERLGQALANATARKERDGNKEYSDLPCGVAIPKHMDVDDAVFIPTKILLALKESVSHEKFREWLATQIRLAVNTTTAHNTALRDRTRDLIADMLEVLRGSAAADPSAPSKPLLFALASLCAELARCKVIAEGDSATAVNMLPEFKEMRQHNRVDIIRVMKDAAKRKKPSDQDDEQPRKQLRTELDPPRVASAASPYAPQQSNSTYHPQQQNTKFGGFPQGQGGKQGRRRHQWP